MVIGRLRSAVADHRAAAEVGLGAGIGLLLGLGTAWQDGFSSDAVLRGVTLGIAAAWATWLVARRRRAEAERAARERMEAQLSLARELHDTVAGQVGVIGIQAAAARHILIGRPEEAAAALERIEIAARDANADLRRMLVALREGQTTASTDGGGPAPSAPGLDGIDGLVRAAAADGLAVRWELDASARSLGDPALDRAAYRIVQEALTNVAAHAGGASVEVRAEVAGGGLDLRVVNGPGRGAPADVRTGPGLGLVGMRERVAAFDGTLDAGPTPEGGFSVHARLPLRREVSR